MRVIVTGGAGRLGRSVLSELVQGGHEVMSVDRATSAVPQVTHVVGDLRDEVWTADAFRSFRPDAVVHLAAIAVPFSAPESEILLTNTALAMSVFTSAVDAGARRVLVAGSATPIGYGSPAGWSPESFPLVESHSTAPWNAYALSKLMIEQIALMFARSHPEVIFGAFRPCFVIAPEEWLGAPTQQGHTVADRLAEPSLAAVSMYNYVDARDAGGFVSRWLDASTPALSGELFFVSAADSLYTGDVRDALVSAFPLAREWIALMEPTSAVFSAAKAERLLGWRPKRSWRTELHRTSATEANPEELSDDMKAAL